MNIRERFSGPVWAVIGTLLIGILGSAIWDFWAKPGVTTVSRGLLNIFTLGSNAMKDAAYADAALDPTALPSLMFLRLAADMPFILAASILLSMLYGARLRAHVGARFFTDNAQTKATTPEDRQVKINERKAWIQQSEKRLKLFRFLLIADLILMGAMSLSKSIVTNQSILVRRTFFANMDICAPYLDENSEEKLRAKFASVKTRGDYIKVRNELAKVAKAQNVEIHTFELW